MIVYADILMFLNLIVDYFLLRLTARFSGCKPKLWRIICAALLGAAFSLSIFLPKIHIATEIFMRLIFCAAITFTCFGYISLKCFLRNAAVFFGVTAGYAGAMFAFWYLFHPNGMVISHSVVYFSISPIFLIGFSAIGYLIVILFRIFLSKNASENDLIEIELINGTNKLKLTALIDTGNALVDVFGMSEVILTDNSIAEKLFNCKLTEPALQSRYRTLPCNTVSGSRLLDGYRCDKAYIINGKKRRLLNRPILAISKTPICGDYQVIIHPRTLSN